MLYRENPHSIGRDAKSAYSDDSRFDVINLLSLLTVIAVATATPFVMIALAFGLYALKSMAGVDLFDGPSVFHDWMY